MSSWPLQPYVASMTGPRAYDFAAKGWGFLMCSAYFRHHRNCLKTGAPVALDNGAWVAFNRGEPWDAGEFEAALGELHERIGWYVLPDRVGQGTTSLRFSLDWLKRLSWAKATPYLAVQDGMTEAGLGCAASTASTGQDRPGSTIIVSAWSVGLRR